MAMHTDGHDDLPNPCSDEKGRSGDKEVKRDFPRSRSAGVLEKSRCSSELVP